MVHAELVVCQGYVNVVLLWLSNVPVSGFGERIERMSAVACGMRSLQSAQFVPIIR
jgi:hypothetical protein